MGNPVVHFEVIGKDPSASQKFYRDLFGWEINADNPMNYGMVHTGSEGGIDGGVGAAPDGTTMVTFYVQVDDPQKYLDRAVELGAKVAMPVMEVPGGPTIAQFADRDGNRVGLLKGM